MKRATAIGKAELQDRSLIALIELYEGELSPGLQLVSDEWKESGTVETVPRAFGEFVITRGWMGQSRQNIPSESIGVPHLRDSIEIVRDDFGFYFCGKLFCFFRLDRPAR